MRNLEAPALFGQLVLARGIVGHGALQAPPKVAIVVGDAQVTPSHV